MILIDDDLTEDEKKDVWVEMNHIAKYPPTLWMLNSKDPIDSDYYMHLRQVALSD